MDCSHLKPGLPRPGSSKMTADTHLIFYGYLSQANMACKDNCCTNRRKGDTQCGSCRLPLSAFMTFSVEEITYRLCPIGGLTQSSPCFGFAVPTKRIGRRFESRPPLQGLPGTAPIAIRIGGVPCQVLAGAIPTAFQCLTISGKVQSSCRRTSGGVQRLQD